MRRGCVLAVSSALLFMSVAFAPCHYCPSANSGTVAALSPSPVIFTEFYPCGLQDDEYFVLMSGSQVPINLLNWSVTDGEGTMRFSKDRWLAPGSRLTISMNSGSYLSAFGVKPDIMIDDPASQQNLSLVGSWRLSDSGDSLSLRDSRDSLVDFVVYGNCSDSSSGWNGPPIPALRKGEIAKRTRASSYHLDTDCRADWFPFREYKYGFTEFEPLDATIAPGDLTSFVSPDCSLEVLIDALDSAKSTIRLCAYELDSSSVCESLLGASARGVDICVLLDGAPAGGISEREVDCASVLSAAGIRVEVLNGNLTQKIVQHVGPLHAKYATVDSRISIVLSENFVESGVPVDRQCGNRGWGIRVDDPLVTKYLEDLFDSDSRASRHDVLDWRTTSRFDPNAILPAIPLMNHTTGVLRPFRSTTESRLRLVPSPDGSPAAPFADSVLSGASSILAEQFQVDLLWDSRWDASPFLNPLLEDIEIAMARGARVKMLLDSTFFNLERNSAVINRLTSDAGNGSWAGEFRLLDHAGPVTLLHNKGAVIDGKKVLISSNNWVYSSFARNRELAAIIESSELAAYFSQAFDFDWIPDDKPPNANAGEDLTVRLGAQVRLDAGNSSDDRAIAHWAWDIDEDGEVEQTTEHATFFATKPGRIEVVLTVEDAWGNKGYDTVKVDILESRAPSHDDAFFSERFGVIVSIASGSIGLLVGSLFARRQHMRSRKLNHPRRD